MHSRGRLAVTLFCLGLLACPLLTYLSWIAGGGRWLMNPTGMTSVATTVILYCITSYLIIQLSPRLGPRRWSGLSMAYLAGSVVVLFGLVITQAVFSRSALLAGFASVAVWVGTYGQLMWRRPIEFYLAPGGDIARLESTEAATFSVLDTPDVHLPTGSAIVADLRHNHDDGWTHFFTNAVLRGHDVYHARVIEEALSGQLDITHLRENAAGALQPDRRYLTLKHILDFILSLVMLPLLAIPMLVVACLIKLHDGGPIFYRQIRMGAFKKQFLMLKFRSMTADLDQSATPDITQAQTQNDDERITPIGRIIRRYRIDELPQIINILRGEMSWIGPRPEAVSLSDQYSERLPNYDYRHIVRPGITGWAQVNQGHVTDLDHVLEKLHFDFYYIKNVSFWLDLVIVAKTTRTIVFGHGAK